MKWKKLGKIFDPRDHSLANGCVEFAQSPQTLLLEDRVRVYFSTRSKDTSGKYLSHISFVDFSRTMDKILGIAKHRVIELGELGCFDEHGIFPMHPFRDGKRILGYTCGWQRRVSVSVETSIGLAESSDNGNTFVKTGKGPVLSSSLHEPFLVGDGFVRKYKGLYHMWYIYGTAWQNIQGENSPARVYKIAHATSEDALSWSREGRQIISDRINPEECQALPTVIERNGTYHMLFCYRHISGFRDKKEKGYRLGYARSNDLKRWDRDDDQAGIDVSSEGWDSDMQCYPHLFECDGKVFLLYNGNEFGRQGFGLALLEE